jgi:hypothetical protein
MFQEHKAVHIALGIVKPILLRAAIVDEMERKQVTEQNLQNFLIL